MPTALENALTKAAELRAELDKIQLFIDLHRQFSDPEVAGGTGGVADGAMTKRDGIKGNVVRSQPVHNSVKKRRGPTPPEIVALVERLIREVGKPMSRGEIVAALEARDVDLPAEDKPRYVGTIMWRNKSKFLNINGYGYWLRGEAIPKGHPSAFVKDMMDDLYKDGIFDDPIGPDPKLTAFD
jgi:hypothetical protein